MASESAEQVKASLQRKLQMADLGTERRERISTNDVHDRYSRIGIDQINADRASNQVGSEVQRLAEKNKAQLNSWATAWKTLSEDVDLEDLDSLMDGQSHRARLADQVKSYGGQSYGEDNTKRSSTRPSRGARGGGGGRGGGVAGTRGRVPNTIGSRPMDQQRIKRVPDLKLGNHAVTPPTQPRRRLDPALQPDPTFYETRSRNRRGPPETFQQEKQHQPQNKKDYRTNKVTTTRRPVSHAGPNFEHVLAPATDFLAAIPTGSGTPSAAPAAPPYDEDSTFFSQGHDKPSKPKKVEESSKKTPDKETPKKDEATKKENTANSENTSKKGPAPKTPRRRPTPKQKQKQAIPTAPTANDDKPASLPHGPKVEAKMEKAEPPQLPLGETKGATLSIAGPSYEKPVQVQETASNILDSEVPQTSEVGVGFQADSSFASSLPQPADEPTPGEDVAADELPDLLLDFSTPPTAKQKNKAPITQNGPAMGELVDISNRVEVDVFMTDSQASRMYQGTCDAASLSAYPNFMGENPEMLAKQQELDQINQLLDQEMNRASCSYLNCRKGIIEARLASMGKNYAKDETAGREPSVIEDSEMQNAEAEAEAEALIDTSVPRIHPCTRAPSPQPASSNNAQISGLKILDLIGTHNLPGRSRNIEPESVPQPPEQEFAKRRGHERESTILSEASSTHASESRMRFKGYIPHSAAAKQYAPGYFKELEEETKRIEELKNGVSSLTLDYPRKATFTRLVSPSPARSAPRAGVASKPPEDRSVPYFPDTAATRQYSSNFGNGPSASSNFGGSKGRSLPSGEHARRTASTDSKASNQPSRLSPTVAPFQPSGNRSALMPPAVAPSFSNTQTRRTNEQKAERGLGASKYADTTKPRSASGLQASKYVVPTDSEPEQQRTPPRYTHSPQRARSQGPEASKRKASQGLEASRYAQPPKRAANQGLETSRYASPARSISGQGLETSKYASASNPKPTQGLSASKYASAANPKPAQGLSASKYAPQSGSGADSGKSQGLEDFKQGSWPQPRGYQRG